VELEELDDEAIDLVSAYSRFKDTLGSTILTSVENTGGYPALTACDAIEALAAIRVLPSLQISLAAKETSGTNQFQRGAIDWMQIRAHLDQLVSAGLALADTTADPAADYGSLLIAVVRTDPVTG
jgi:hypothetical protein